MKKERKKRTRKYKRRQSRPGKTGKRNTTLKANQEHPTGATISRGLDNMNTATVLHTTGIDAEWQRQPLDLGACQNTIRPNEEKHRIRQRA